MLKYCLLFFILSSQSHAQFFDRLQNHPDIEWKEINSDNFKVIYPSYLEKNAHKTMHMLEYFRPKVKNQYEVHSDKVPVILRPQVALPNGFVTVGPRRSEWFNHASLSPLVGSDDWLVSLAVHELRHVIQFDTITSLSFHNIVGLHRLESIPTFFCRYF